MKIYPREILEEKTKLLRDARNEVMRKFTLLIEGIIGYNKSLNVSAKQLSIEDLNQKFKIGSMVTSQDSSQGALVIPILLIEYNLKRTSPRSLLIIQNASTSIIEEIKKINNNKLYVLFLTV